MYIINTVICGSTDYSSTVVKKISIKIASHQHSKHRHFLFHCESATDCVTSVRHRTSAKTSAVKITSAVRFVVCAVRVFVCAMRVSVCAVTYFVRVVKYLLVP